VGTFGKSKRTREAIRLAKERERRGETMSRERRRKKLESFAAFCERQSKRLDKHLSASVEKIEQARDPKHPTHMALVQTIRIPGRREQFISEECPYGLSTESLRVITSD
jgi:hypothetical protein